MNDISELIEKCVIAAAWVKPESRVTDTHEIYKIENIQSPFGFLNGIYRTRFSNKKADAQILAHFNSYKDRKISFRWYYFSSSRPSDLESRLIALQPSSVTDLVGLCCDVDRFQLDTPPGVTVEELSFANLDDYCRASNDGWGQTGAEAEKIVRDTRRDLERGETGRQSFLARYNGEPASTGLLKIVGNSGYLLGGSTRPQFRNKGIYSALVKHRLDVLKTAKIPTALILARKATSAPICLKLGFKVGCDCKSFDFNF